MSLRKQLVLIMLLLVTLTTGLYSIISGSYIDKYFTGFVQRQYNQQVDKISAYAVSVLENPTINLDSAAIDLTRYMEDPITQVVISKPTGEILLTAKTEGSGGQMRGKMMHRRFQVEADQYTLKRDDQIVGILTIERNATIQNSESVFLFKEALMMGSLISGGIILILSLTIVLWLSRKMTKDLNQTATFASALQSSDEGTTELDLTSKTTEINAIQMSLKNLSAKLKLQHQIQREKADQLAHEARTPLTLLKTHVEGVLDGVIEMDESRLESCLHQVDLLSQVLSNISSVVSVQEDPIQCQKVSFDLTSDLKKITKAVRMVLSQKSISLHMDLPNELIVMSDPALVSQILYNLLTNASKFTPSGGVITIRGTLQTTSRSVFENAHSGKFVRISVSDSGQGISPEQLGLIFNAYYRSPDVRHIPGEGLGLYIAKRNAEILGASLFAENLESGGACFTLELPI